MTFRSTFARLALVAGLCVGATSAFALSLDAAGNITNWGITPFNNTGDFGNWGNGAPPLASGVNGIQRGTRDGITYVEGNNAAPIDYRGLTGLYPDGPPYVPAPSDVDAGEVFDNEFLAWRVVGNNLQILAITSINPFTGSARPGSSNFFHPGDIFIDADGDGTTGVRGYEFAAAINGYESDRNDPLHPGDDNPTWTHPTPALYELDSEDDIHEISDEGGFGNTALYPEIAAANNPFAVREGASFNNALFGYDFQSFDYGTRFGANEDNTWIIEWTIDLSLLSLLGENINLETMTLHWTTGCGNDFLDTPPVVPEPATISLLGLGLASLGALRRRKRA